MRTIRLFETAEDDIDAIYDYYFSINPSLAIKIHNSIVHEIGRLSQWPDIGSPEPLGREKQYPFRSLVTKDGLFKVIYFVTNDSVFITRIWCCRKNPTNLNL